MRYKYLASAASGQIVSGTIDAGEEASAEKVLGQAGYTVLTLKAARPRPSFPELFPTLFRIKPDQVIGLARQLATLLESGIDMITAVEIVREQSESSMMSKTLSEIADTLRGGSSLSEALGKYPAVFAAIFRRMVAIGEQTGSPDEALRQAALNMDKQRQAAKKIKQALMYPCIVTGMALLVAAVLVVVVLPPMVDMFTSLGAELPLPTRLLMAATSLVNDHFMELSLAAIGAVVALILLLRRPRVRRELDRSLLRIPQVGRVLLCSELARFTRTMSTLLQAGVALSEGMEMAISTCGNRIVREALEAANREMLQGEGLSGPLSRNKLFPAMLVQMVRVGEETGRLDVNLAVVANAYETEATDRTQTMISTIEPTLTLAIASGVGFIAVSVIMPMYSLMGSIQ